MEDAPKPLTILLAAGGGVLTVAKRSLEQMSRDGIPARVVVLSPCAEPVFGLDGLPHLEFSRAYSKDLMIHNRSSVAGIAVSTFRYVMRERPRRVFCWGKELALFYRATMGPFARDAKIAMSSNSHTSSHLRSGNVAKRTALTALYRWLLPQIVCIGALTRAMEDDLVSCFGVSVKQLCLAPPFVIERFFSVPLADLENNRDLLFVGRLSAEKNLHHLLKAFSLCADKAPEARLVLAGDGPMRRELEQEAARLPCFKRIVFAGHVDDPCPYFRKARVLALCSHYEGFGLVLAEALAAGVPVVSYNLPSGPRDIVQDGVNGFLAECQNVEDLAEKLLKAWDWKWSPEVLRGSVEKYKFDLLWPAYRHMLTAVREEGVL